MRWIAKSCESGGAWMRPNLSRCLRNASASGGAGASGELGQRLPRGQPQQLLKESWRRTPSAVFSGLRLEPFFALKTTTGASIGSAER